MNGSGSRGNGQRAHPSAQAEASRTARAAVVISVRLTSASTAAAWLLEVRDGRIVRQTVWNDLAAIRRQLL